LRQVRESERVLVITLVIIETDQMLESASPLVMDHVRVPAMDQKSGSMMVP